MSNQSELETAMTIVFSTLTDIKEILKNLTDKFIEQDKKLKNLCDSNKINSDFLTKDFSEIKNLK